MKKIALVFFTLSLVGSYTYGQDCDCLSQFQFVKNYFESNNPAFQKIKADRKALQDYQKKVSSLTDEIRKETSGDLCNIYFSKYVSFLKDHHSSIDINLQRKKIDFNSKAVVDSFKLTQDYRAFRKVEVDTTKLLAQLQKAPVESIEGIYTNGGSIKIGIVRAGKNRYHALVLQKNKLLDVGHLLLELEQSADNTFACRYNLGLLGFNFQQVYQDNIRFVHGSFPNLGYTKLNLPSTDTPKLYAFREIDAQTNYLQLKSFDYSLKSELDSLYSRIDPLIRSKPFLIIDLRDNGGGAEACYFDLLPYVYTRPLRVDEVQVWVSPDNIRKYEESPNRDEELIARMKKAEPFTFIPQKEEAVSTWTTESSEFPKKVGVLYNRGTASSAEGMITYCIQSDKVVTLGENSGGYIGFGNVMNTEIPCGKYTLRSTTTKYKNNAIYEFVGIAPMVKLSTRQGDWIEIARKTLQNEE